MLFGIFSLIFVAKASVLGGWQNVPVDHESVKAQSEYLNRNIPNLFPEFENQAYEIVSAKIQVVRGINMKLVIKASSSPLLIQLTMYIDLAQKPKITKIKKAIGSKPIFGGWTWLNPKQFTSQQLDQTMQLILKKANIIMKTGSGKVLAYRTKLDKGLETHVIFEDAQNNLFSAVTKTDSKTSIEDLVKVSLIF